MGCLVAAGTAPAQPAAPPGTEAAACEPRAEVCPDPAPPSPRAGGDFWFRGEYLLWRVSGSPLPALVGRIPADQAEMIQTFSNSTITPLVGGGASRLDYDAQSGLRLETGFWLDGDRRLGLAVGFFQLEQGRRHFQADSQGQQALGPTFFVGDVSLGQEALVMDGVPGLRAGTVTADTSEHLWGTEVNALHPLSAGGFLDHLELLAGFRYLQFSEEILIRGTSRAIPGGSLPCG